MNFLADPILLKGQTQATTTKSTFQGQIFPVVGTAIPAPPGGED